MKKEVWYIPVEKPSVVGWKPPGTITGDAGRFEAWTVEVLGPPVPALPDALSPEAARKQSLRDAVVETSLEGHKCSVVDLGPDYANNYWQPHAQACEALLAFLTSPDPLCEAREALADLRRLHYSGSRMFIIDRLSAALDRLAEQGGAA